MSIVLLLFIGVWVSIGTTALFIVNDVGCKAARISVNIMIIMGVLFIVSMIVTQYTQLQ